MGFSVLCEASCLLLAIVYTCIGEYIQASIFVAATIIIATIIEGEK